MNSAPLPVLPSRRSFGTHGWGPSPPAARTLNAPEGRGLYEVRIVGRQVVGAPKRHIVFVIETRAGSDNTFTSRRRFREFVALHAALRERLTFLPEAFPVPKLLFHTARSMRARARGLQQYLAAAVDAEWVQGGLSPALSAFLCVSWARGGPAAGGTESLRPAPPARRRAASASLSSLVRSESLNSICSSLSSLQSSPHSPPPSPTPDARDGRELGRPQRPSRGDASRNASRAASISSAAGAEGAAAAPPAAPPAVPSPAAPLSSPSPASGSKGAQIRRLKRVQSVPG